jgi:hypothetical protein
MLNCRLAAFSLLLLAGCAAPNIDKAYSLDSSRGAGVAVGSLTYSGGYAAYRLHVVDVASGESYKFEHGESQTLNLAYAFKGEPINPDLGMRGAAFAIELPAGNYSVRAWQVSQGAANVWSTEPTGISFRVEPGRAIYLGNFHFRETSRRVRAITGATVTLSEMSERDIPVLQKAYPSLKVSPIAQSLEPKTRIENVGGKSDGKISIPIFIPVAR